MAPTLDVITLAYNQKPFLLHRSIEFSLKVANRVIVVDDGSERPVSELPITESPKVVVIRHKSNLGVPAAFNTALRHLESKYAVRCMSDDYLFPRDTQKQLDVMESRNLAATFHDYMVVGDMAKAETAMRAPIPQLGRSNWRKKLLEDNLIYCGTTMVRREVLENYGGHPELPHCQDWNFHLWVEENYGWNKMYELYMARGAYSHGLSYTRDGQLFWKERASVSKHWRERWKKMGFA